jgi:diaminopimelate decarboxylase
MNKSSLQPHRRNEEFVVSHDYSPLSRSAVQNDLVTEDTPLVGLIDIEGVERTVASLKEAFPDHFEHHYAVKSNGMSAVLSLVRQQGMLAETASPGELLQALQAGYIGSEIVFDEPVKTPKVLREVLSMGATLHLDNFTEMERVAKLLPKGTYSNEIGYRINPQVGLGSIKAMSTAGLQSKFGVAIDDEGNRDRIISDYLKHPWLNTLHTHIGSQGCSFEMVSEGIAKIVDLAVEINQHAGEKRIRSIDIGGGLGVNFHSDEVTPTFQQYSDFLRARVPLLFTGDFRVKTEFGRAIMAKNGCMLARVEYAKVSGGRHIAAIHAGAQVATRTVFMPESWPLRLSAYDAEGNRKTGNLVDQDIAGPCCFAGDLIATSRNMSKLESGDMVMVHDTGAYYFSNPFYYNALPAPAVYGYRVQPNGEISMEPYRSAQTQQSILDLIG